MRFCFVRKGLVLFSLSSSLAIDHYLIAYLSSPFLTVPPLQLAYFRREARLKSNAHFYVVLVAQTVKPRCVVICSKGCDAKGVQN